ncbi:MAG: autotransporter domain-containing protein [Neisseriaceae bacterium]
MAASSLPSTSISLPLDASFTTSSLLSTPLASSSQSSVTSSSSLASSSAIPLLLASSSVSLTSSAVPLVSSGLPLLSSLAPLSSSLSLPSLASSIPLSSSAAPLASSSLPLLSSLAPLSSSLSLPSLASSIPLSSSAAPLLSSSLPLLSSLAPLSSSLSLPSLASSIPLSSSAAPLLSSSLPLASSSAPLSSSLLPSSGLPSLSSLAPLSGSVAPIAMSSSYGPIISGAGSALSWKATHPSRSTWKYGFHDYNYEAVPQDFEFRNLVTFGDSLSDTGSFGRGSIYMADGNPYVFYNSYLALALSGKPVTPEKFGGANYAMSGAVLRSDPLDPLSWIMPRDTLKNQVARYLARNGGRAHPDDAFVIWGGGNDVTQDIQLALANPFNWSTVFSGPGKDQAYLNDKADYPGLLAQSLIDHGARGPILVMNLPSSAYTSFTGVMFEGTMDLGMITGGTPFDVFNLGGWLMKAQDDYLRNPANRVGDLAAGKGIEYFRENNINAIQHRYPFIPRALVEAYFDTMFNGQNNVVNWFNQAQENRVAKVRGGNVVQLDVNQLFKEVIDDPLAYGIDEILVPECGIGHVAPNCDEGDDYYHGRDGRRYMYTDWHHPSALMHRIVAEYAIATVNAPAYITGLSRSLELGTKARQDYLLSELTRINSRLYEGQGQTYVFGGFSGGFSKQKRSLNNHSVVYNGLNIGYGYRPTEGADLGIMGSLGLSKVQPHRNLKFNQLDLALTAFAQYSAGPWWINGQVSAGSTKFDDIKRSVPLGAKTRVEKSETEGSSWGARVETGYEFSLGTTWVLAPMVAYTKNHYEVKGFEEDGNSSTAMRFKKQSRNQEYATFGFRISDDCPDDFAWLRGSVDLTYNQELNHDKNKLIGEGGLKRYTTTFSREANRLVKDSKGWYEIKPTVQFKLNKNSRITTSVSYSFDRKKSKNKNLSYSVGYRYEF